jgi:hypothetical protein
MPAFVYTVMNIYYFYYVTPWTLFDSNVSQVAHSSIYGSVLYPQDGGIRFEETEIFVLQSEYFELTLEI